MVRSISDPELTSLLHRIQAGEVRAIARTVSNLENDPTFAPRFLPIMLPYYQKKPRLGITGSPGVGKSTLVNELIRFIRRQSWRVGIVAVDPTSPFSGGAILGDRIRMQAVQNDPNVYIRSMGSRGSLGGLSAASANVARVLELAGADFIILETVGMGQTGFDIVDIADTVVLLLSPESGDGVQTMKAGVMEIADIYVVNKADRPGAEGLATEIRSLLGMVRDRLSWEPPVLLTSAIRGEGVSTIWQEFQRHQSFLAEQGKKEQKWQQQVAREIIFIIESRLQRALGQEPQIQAKLNQLAELVSKGAMDTYTAAERLLASLLPSLQDTVSLP